MYNRVKCSKAKYTPYDYWKTLETVMKPSIQLLVEEQQKTIEELNTIISKDTVYST